MGLIWRNQEVYFLYIICNQHNLYFYIMCKNTNYADTFKNLVLSLYFIKQSNQYFSLKKHFETDLRNNKGQSQKSCIGEKQRGFVCWWEHISFLIEASLGSKDTALSKNKKKKKNDDDDKNACRIFFVLMFDLYLVYVMRGVQLCLLGKCGRVLQLWISAIN